MLPLYLVIVLALGDIALAQLSVGCVTILDQDTCRPGYRCVRGQCRPDIGQPNECSMNRDCSFYEECRLGRCVPKRNSGDTCMDNRDCSFYKECRLGRCVPKRNSGDTCMDNRDCSFYEECRLGRCVPKRNTPECRRDIDCPYGRCQRGTCVGSPTNTCDPYRGIRCSRGYRCVNRQCLPNDEFECGPQGPCQSGYRCRMGLCVRDVNPQPTCRTNRECPSYQRCVQGNCVQRAG